MIDAPFAQIYSANLTPGKGGAGSEFSDADFIRALRQGVDNQGRALVVMPAQVFWNFNDLILPTLSPTSEPFRLLIRNIQILKSMLLERSCSARECLALTLSRLV